MEFMFLPGMNALPALSDGFGGQNHLNQDFLAIVRGRAATATLSPNPAQDQYPAHYFSLAKFIFFLQVAPNRSSF